MSHEELQHIQPVYDETALAKMTPEEQQHYLQHQAAQSQHAQMAAQGMVFDQNTGQYVAFTSLSPEQQAEYQQYYQQYQQLYQNNIAYYSQVS